MIPGFNTGCPAKFSLIWHCILCHIFIDFVATLIHTSPFNTFQIFRGFSCIFFVLYAYLCWILIDFHGQITGNDASTEFLARIAQNARKKSQNNHKMSMKFLQKSTQKSLNFSTETYRNLVMNWTLWKSELPFCTEFSSGYLLPRDFVSF